MAQLKPEYTQQEQIQTPIPERSGEQRIVRVPTTHHAVQYFDVPPKAEITAEQLAYAAALPFRPNLTKTLYSLDRFIQIPTRELRNIVRGVLIDIDGTLTSFGGQQFDEEILEKLIELRRNFGVCFYSHNNDSRPELAQTGIPFARNIPEKPDPVGFKMAARLKLDLAPHQCAMIGDNYITDGGSRSAGMPFIHVKPIPGKEPIGYKLLRAYGELTAKTHTALRRKKRK